MYGQTFRNHPRVPPDIVSFGAGAQKEKDKEDEKEEKEEKAEKGKKEKKLKKEQEEEKKDEEEGEETELRGVPRLMVRILKVQS